ncbi:MAG: insulinase family protein, partial [Candidatus Zixiibacteriota bacterium]
TAMYQQLFKKHQYGLQTTLGSVEHLKNPSMQKVIDYFNTYYVPNNMAICLSGDFDPDEMIKLIDAKFGDYQPKEVPIYISPKEDSITSPIDTTVMGPSEESVRFAFRFNGSGSLDVDYIRIIDMLMNNSVAGLIDINLNQKQKVLGAGSYTDIMQDYGLHVFFGRPREGQTLEEVKDLLLEQIELIKVGEFPDWLMTAVINDFKLSQLRGYESNWSRVMTFVTSFTEEIPYEHDLTEIDRLSAITKKDIVDFANKHYGNNYVVVYKKIGEDNLIEKIAKPLITPVELNQTDQSEFAQKISNAATEPLEPKFLDFDKDIVKIELNGKVPLYYVANDENDIFTMYYNLDIGNNNDKRMGIALDYLEYLGAGDLNPIQLKEEFYKIGCSYSVSCNDENLWVSLTGLAENFEAGVQLLEKLLNDPKTNEEALINLKSDILKSREDIKLNKGAILRGAMRNYGVYGPISPYTNIVGRDELEKLTSDELLALIKTIPKYEHRVLYYGPQSIEGLSVLLNKYHKAGPEFLTSPQPVKFVQIPNEKDIVYVVNYDMKQAEIYMLSKSETYNRNNKAIRDLFNKYFGESVFYTLRESKALAYSTRGSYSSPDNPDDAHYIEMYIGTQSDKLKEALSGMRELLDQLPQDEASFEAAKDAIVKRIQAERITKTDILFNYESAQRMGNDHDMRIDVYENCPSMELADLNYFHDEYFKNKHFTTLVLGDTTKLDENILSQFGDVKYLTLEDIFGF